MVSYFLGSASRGNSTSTPVLPLTTVTPTLGFVPNYDTDRDGFAGLLIAKSGVGMSETDPTKRQIWAVTVAAPLRLSGVASVTIWAAIKSFDTAKDGRFVLGLQDCNGAQTSCTTLATGSAVVDQASGGASFIAKTISFGSPSHTVSAGRRLVVRVVVDNLSDDDMWFAYNTAAQKSVLSVTVS